MYTSSFLSPFGYMRSSSSETGLYALDWDPQPFPDLNQENEFSRETIKQIQHYLNGQLSVFTVPLDLSRYSPTLVKWLSVLATVPFGHIVTYSELAQKWGNIKAARAAGQACKRNPLPIILPCHRIVRSSGKLANYSAGNSPNPNDPNNIMIKQWLIKLESQKGMII